MSLPLAGMTVMVTRPAAQVEDLARPLQELGAEVVTMPAIEIAQPLDRRPLDSALRNLGDYDWVVLTSVNGVDAVRRAMDEVGVPIEEMNERKLAVIGPATGAALTKAFRAPDLMPAEFVSEAIAQALGDVAGKRFLLARADIARRDLAQILALRGAEVDEVIAYRIVRPDATRLPATVPNYITLTSSAGVRGTRDALVGAGLEDWLNQAALVCIGPITAGTVRELGYEPTVVAKDYTIQGMVAALVEYARRTHV
ncbi:uroporphyrinogen-III synthase [Fimbriimonas ginsengisoli]|uniref:Uroporphyrinogen-III C-methyltransferase / uroporphyrinogen-III synthase n=1 Tax=Fimbriimonas ginsengisoli Gsoil 348 TaxID=661478 RepID=A0A068NNG6_FIMGI|nr:uroporphyrinogen-III synthase [Fimbriimonas ginsengisoli]AIE84305.1 uroporphyrinogen-III C-methyltransferase / uroporphyrinogen-III synthase [Fimbriimonas ginsengisoli Gsoil 348]